MDTLSLPVITIPAKRQIIHPFRIRSRLVCVPSLDPHLLRKRQSFVLRKAVPRLPQPRSFRLILWTQRTPPTHHGQVENRPQHEYTTQMPLLHEFSKHAKMSFSEATLQISHKMRIYASANAASLKRTLTTNCEASDLAPEIIAPPLAVRGVALTYSARL